MLKFITHRPLWANVLAGAALALIILFVFIFSLGWCTHHGQSKLVPSVLGKSIEEAEKILDGEGFELEILDSVYTDTTKAGIVLKQQPEADEIVKVNRTVYLTVNRKVPPMVEMPFIEGYSYRSAEMALKSANLRVGAITYKHNFAKDAVLEQLYDGKQIKAGTKIPMGSVIALVLSDGVGEEKLAVPDLRGMTYCEARPVLQGMGLDFGAVVAEGISDTCSAYIFRQSPTKFDEDNRPKYIHSGQLMDVWLQKEKPVIDSLGSEPGEPQ